MFNEEIKQKFISSKRPSGKMYTISTQDTIRTIFDMVQVYEHEYQVDFAQMNALQMQTTLDNIGGVRARTAEAIFYYLKEYVKWCAQNGMQTSEAINVVRVDAIEKFRSCMVSSPAHLKKCIDAAFPNPECNTIEYVYRALLWLAFIGFHDFEAIQIRESDVKLEDMLIVYPGRFEPYMIYSEALPDIRKVTNDLPDFLEPRGKNGVVKQREFGDRILRGKVTKKTPEQQLATTIPQMLSRAFKNAADKYTENGMDIPRDLSLNLSYSRVRLSGVFYRAYDLERMGCEPTFNDEVSREFQRKKAQDRYTIKEERTESKIQYEIRKNYLEDYARWKSAFSV